MSVIRIATIELAEFPCARLRVAVIQRAGVIAARHDTATFPIRRALQMATSATVRVIG